MKYIPKIFIIASISIVWLYLLLIVLSSNSILISDVIDVWILVVLITNATLVVPVVMYRKLDDRDRKKFIKILAVLSLIFISCGMIFMHVALPRWGNTEGWEIIANWFFSIIFVLSFITTTFLSFIGIVLYKLINRKTEEIFDLMSLVIFDFILPFFSIVLLIWSFFLITSTMDDIFR